MHEQQDQWQQRRQQRWNASHCRLHAAPGLAAGQVQLMLVPAAEQKHELLPQP